VFADEYPRFNEVSGLKQKPHRMNQRYEALFAANRDIFEGARVLDLASHDGRWSFAALKTGAAHVTGVEVRDRYVEKARETFAFYGQDPETYRFVCGDVFEVLAREKFDVDVVLCLGYLYHTYRHTELMYRIHDLAPTHLILDTRVVRGKQPSVKVILENNPAAALNAAREEYSLDRVLVGHHTMPGLQMLLAAYGFETEYQYDWARRLARQPRASGLQDYARGNRVTLRCRARPLAIAAEWQAAAPAPATPRKSRARKRGQAPVRKSGQAPARKRGQTPARKRGQAPAPPPQPTARWRRVVNWGLAKATGYELRRASPKR
jgi:SAM-dependent methyltransferase